MASIEWDDGSSVGVKIIDEQHRHFIDIMNRLYESLDKGDASKVPGLLTDLKNYTDYHFGTEEKYFADFNYDGAIEHIAAHRDLVVKVNEFISRKDDQVVVGYDLLDFLTHWLADHLDNMDKKYTECFHQHGLY